MGESVVFLRGVEIDLVVVNKEHINIYHEWVNDPIVRKFLNMEFSTTLEVMKKEWFGD